MPPELLQVQVLEYFENNFSRWERKDFGLLTISNLNRRLHGQKINGKTDEFIDTKNIVRIPHTLKSKTTGNDLRLADICNSGSRTKLNLNPPIGSFYCERLPKDLQNIPPQYRKHDQCGAILDYLDEQAICDGYQGRIMQHNSAFWSHVMGQMHDPLQL